MKRQVLFVWFLMFIAVLIFGCEKKTGSAAPPRGNPIDYFPMAVGTTWTYRIALGDIKPLKYEETLWPQGGSRIVMATRGFFLASFSEDKTKDFLLKIRIKGLASKQAELEYPLGVELEVLQDDFGIFEHHKKMFFAGTPHGGLMVHRVETRDYDSPGAPSSGIWGGWGENGYTMPIVFFARRPGIGIGMGEKSSDVLFFVGQEKSPLGHKDSLHFQRRVEPSEKKQNKELSELDKGFVEDTWFARGIGLVHLVQRIDDEISMEWTLSDFSH